MYGFERLRGRADKPNHTSEYLPTYLPGDYVRMHETHFPDRCPEDRPAIVIVNGWSSNHSMLEIAAQGLAEHGEYVVTMDYPRDTLCEGNALLPRQASLQAVIERVNEKLGRRAHLVGHSTGGIDGTRTLHVLEYAGMLDLVSGFSLVASAGMLDDSTGPEVVGGALLETAEQIRGASAYRRKFGDLGLAAVGMLWDRRLLTAEAREVIPTYIIPELKRASEASGGPSIRVFPCEGDMLYRHHRVEKKLAEELQDTTIEIEVLRARHMDLTAGNSVVLNALSRHVTDTLRNIDLSRVSSFGVTA